VAVPIDPIGAIKYAVLKRVGDMLTHTVGGESDRIFGAEEVTTRKTPEVIATTYGNAYKGKIDALARSGDLLSENPKNAGAREIGKAGVRVRIRPSPNSAWRKSPWGGSSPKQNVSSPLGSVTFFAWCQSGTRTVRFRKYWRSACARSKCTDST